MRGARTSVWVSLLAILPLLAGCLATTGLRERFERAAEIAADGGLERRRFEAPPFILTGYQRGISGPGRALTVYIEGDGPAWVGRRRVAADPTPRDPLALRLAAADPAGKVLYLARPCQYTTAATARGCDSRYWSSHRAAEEVVAATSAAIDQAKAASGASELTLVGYSGGGAVAALVAARRDDVKRLITVAATLDYPTWTTHHGVSPMPHSLNPAEVAGRLGRLPQTHFVGADDEVVPAKVARAYLARLPDLANARLVVVPDFDHRCCWAKAWPALVRQARQETIGTKQAPQW